MSVDQGPGAEVLEDPLSNPTSRSEARPPSLTPLRSAVTHAGTAAQPHRPHQVVTPLSALIVISPYRLT